MESIQLWFKSHCLRIFIVQHKQKYITFVSFLTKSVVISVLSKRVIAKIELNKIVPDASYSAQSKSSMNEALLFGRTVYLEVAREIAIAWKGK